MDLMREIGATTKFVRLQCKPIQYLLFIRQIRSETVFTGDECGHVSWVEVKHKYSETFMVAL